MIPYGKHHLEADDIAAVVDVLENQFLTQGQQVPLFEQALVDYTGASHCVAVNSGTSALHIACLAAELGTDDWLWTSPISFVASANCGLYCGAHIDFVDIDPVTRNICPNALADKLATAKQQDKLPKILVVVHFAGLSCEMQRIKQLADQYGVWLIEDAAHGLGGHYQGAAIGSCAYSHMTCLSFHPVKSITTAEGGAVTTNDAYLAKQLALYAKHGVTRDSELMVGESEGPWYYQQVALGYNYRLSDLQAALGISQLKKLSRFIQKRTELAEVYTQAFANTALKLPVVTDGNASAWHIYMIEVPHSRREIFARLQEKGIGVNVHYIPIHLQPYYRQLGFEPGNFPHAEQFYAGAITLPLYPDLTAEQQAYVIDCVKEAIA